jgi:hypothetical protein
MAVVAVAAELVGSCCCCCCWQVEFRERETPFMQRPSGAWLNDGTDDTAGNGNESLLSVCLSSVVRAVPEFVSVKASSTADRPRQSRAEQSGSREDRPAAQRPLRQTDERQAGRCGNAASGRCILLDRCSLSVAASVPARGGCFPLARAGSRWTATELLQPIAIELEHANQQPETNDGHITLKIR